MKVLQVSLQISPEARAAYFHEYVDVARQELEWVFPGLTSDYRKVGGLEFFDLEIDEGAVQGLSRLSFVLGVYERAGERLVPLAVDPAFALHEDFVFGNKYRGKTNERLTQLLLNVALARCDASPAALKLLDPMCGRGTTLLWALCYGMRARGIEQEAAALADVRRHLKKWTKLHRVKHRLQEGSVTTAREAKAGKPGKGDKKQRARSLEFTTDAGGLRLVNGDAREARALLGGERFELIVSDLPYGVQHFTTRGTRNPLAVLEQCAEAWTGALKPGGVMALAFNSYQPKRKQLLNVFESAGLTPLDFCAAHRMSESIVRDVVVMQAPEGEGDKR